MSEHDKDEEKIKANGHERTELERIAKELMKDIEDGVDIDEAIRRHQEKVAPLTQTPCQMACQSAYYQCLQQHGTDCGDKYLICLEGCD